jgi:hypothetical protein
LQFNDLVSNVSGILGILCGMSVFSMVEIMFVIVQAIFVLFTGHGFWAKYLQIIIFILFYILSCLNICNFALQLLHFIDCKTHILRKIFLKIENFYAFYASILVTLPCNYYILLTALWNYLIFASIRVHLQCNTRFDCWKH